MNPVVRLAGLRHRYGAVLAADGLDLEIPAGRMVGFIGPDGVGKSTWLGLIAGARQIQQGQVEVLGGDMATARHREAVCPRIAYMPQGLGKNLYPTLSVFENIDFFGRLFGQGRAERARRIAELLAAVLECLYGNYFGPIIILSGLVQGLGFELIIALKRYKMFDRLTMIQGAVICSVLTLIYNLFISGYSKIAVPVLAIMLVVRIISAIVFDGFITPMLADGLVKAGVLKGYAVAQGQDMDLED